MVQITKIDQAGEVVIANAEGVRLVAYQDEKGVWTLGIGSTYLLGPDGKTQIPVKQGDTLPSREAAFALFRNVVKDFENAVASSVKVELNQKQFNALVCFAFNIGIGNFKTSTLLKRLNLGEYNKVGEELIRWNLCENPQTKKLVPNEGLTVRRMREYLLFYSWDNRKIV